MIIKNSVIYGDFLNLKVGKKRFKSPTVKIIFGIGKYKLYDSDLAVKSW